jgi:hypothetical protein
VWLFAGPARTVLLRSFTSSPPARDKKKQHGNGLHAKAKNYSFSNGPMANQTKFIQGNFVDQEHLGAAAAVVAGESEEEMQASRGRARAH